MNGPVKLTPASREAVPVFERLQESYPVNQLCSLFGAHRSSYRAWHARPKMPSPEEWRLRARAEAAHVLSNGSAGAQTIAKMSRRRGCP
jgi:putative transposase